MKDRTKRIPSAIFLTVIAITLLTLAIRTAFLFTAYEAEVGYLQPGLPTILVSILYLLGTAICLGSFFLLPKVGLEANSSMHPIISYALKLPPVAACFLCGIIYLTSGALNSKKIFLLLGAFLLISTLYFIFSLLCDLSHAKPILETTRPWLILFVFAALMLLLATAYFDMTVTINGPFTTLYLFSLLSLAVFFLGEMRNDIHASVPRMHFASGLVALFLNGSSSIGNLLFCMLGNTGTGKTLADPLRPILSLTFSLFVLYRILSFIIPGQKK